MVAAAAIGGAVIGGVASNRAAKKSSSAVREGAQTSAAAQVEATRLQVEEIGRQFDYQQQVLQPQIQRQYAAQGAYSDLLGINSPSGQFNPDPDSGFNPRGNYPGQTVRSVEPDGQGGYRAGGRQIKLGNGRPITTTSSAQGNYTAERMNNMNRTQFNRGAHGEFVDPNLDPTRLAEAEQLTGQVAGSRLAPTNPDADPYRNYIADNQIAADSLDEDARFARARDVTHAGDTLTEDPLYSNIGDRLLAEGAAGTGVYGEEFEASPGYAFQVEEMGRELDRRNSRGGNFGGRAIMEAQRRAQGLAQGDYYNWAQGRTMDLQRQAGAEAQDAGRLDSAAGNYMARRSHDITRGDMAVDAYEGQRVADVGRGDTAYENYLGRQTQDAARMDAAVAEKDRLRGVDLQRRDQGYYNYLNALSQQAGFGNPASQAVQSSQAAGAQTAGAYARQGSGLSQIYGTLGAQQAGIQHDRYANINNAAQSGIQNWMTYQMSQPAAA